MTVRSALRWLLGVLYLVAGYFHLVRPEPFRSITPDWVPFPAAVIFWTGIAEFAGAAALLQPWSRDLRRAGGIGLAIYAICVFPANVHHFMLDMARSDPALGVQYHVPRMLAQPVLIGLALWTGGVTNWPFAKRRPAD